MIAADSEPEGFLDEIFTKVRDQLKDIIYVEV
jgi:hypothetical protein